MEEEKLFKVIIEPDDPNFKRREYKFNRLDNAIEVVEYEHQHCPESNAYIVDFMGNILNIK